LRNDQPEPVHFQMHWPPQFGGIVVVVVVNGAQVDVVGPLVVVGPPPPPPPPLLHGSHWYVGQGLHGSPLGHATIGFPWHGVLAVSLQVHDRLGVSHPQPQRTEAHVLEVLTHPVLPSPPATQTNVQPPVHPGGGGGHFAGGGGQQGVTYTVHGSGVLFRMESGRGQHPPQLAHPTLIPVHPSPPFPTIQPFVEV
jgi:hypothetical protein